MDEIQTRLAALAGTWRGRGRGRYPTIDSFEYSESLRFELDSAYPLIHYEQRTRLLDGQPSHWESGFLRWLEDGTLELSNAQNGGRVEVLRGRLAASFDDPDFTLVLESVALAHDPRMLQSRRTLELRGERLRYLVEMSTTTTDTPLLQQHLEAELRRD